MKLMKDIRLDKNELPYLPPEEVLEAITKATQEINRYTPQEKIEVLKDLLADYNNLPPESILLRPASDILIKELIFLFARDRKIIICDPTFIIIQNAVQKTNSPILKVKLRPAEFKFPTEVILKEINEPTLVFLDNPNNPTGKLIITEQEIESLLQNKYVLLFIDEAYYEFSDFTVASLVEKYNNLGVLRTLSKSFGLAGAGSGYLIAGQLIKKKLSGLEVMLPYPSVMGSILALKNRDFFRKKLKEIQTEKTRIKTKVEELGITTYSSQTNFLLMNTKNPYIAQELSKHGIYVYDASNYFTQGYLRVSIGTKKENNRFLEVLESLIKE